MAEVENFRSAWRREAGAALSQRHSVTTDDDTADHRILALLDALDAAERERDYYRERAHAYARSADDTRTRARRAEAALARVEALAEKWAGWGQVDSVKANTVARDIRAALNGADA